MSQTATHSRIDKKKTDNMKLKMLLLFIVISVTACYHGFTTGYHSSPVGGVKSEEFDKHGPWQGAQKHRLEFSGIELYINPSNTIATTEMAFLLLFIPYHMDLEDTSPEESNFVFKFYLKPKVPGYIFNPKAIILKTDNTVVPLVKISDSSSSCKSWRIDDSFISNIEKVAENSVELTDIDKWHCYSLEFGMLTPSPETEFSLDLSKALMNPSEEEIPLIIFKKSSWTAHGA